MSYEVAELCGLLKNAYVYGRTNKDFEGLKKHRNTVNKLLFLLKTKKINKVW